MASACCFSPGTKKIRHETGHIRGRETVRTILDAVTTPSHRQGSGDAPEPSNVSQRAARLPAWLQTPSPRLLIALTAFCWWLAGAFQVFPLGWVALVPYFLLVHDQPVGRRFGLGYACGYVSFALINWWLVPTITRGAPAIGSSPFVGFFLSLVAVALVAFIHSWQTGFVALLARGNSLWNPLVLAGVWTVFDWVRCQGPIAHSWGALAFTQTTDVMVLNWGQHLLTFWCVLVAALLAMAWRQRSSKPLVAACGVLVFFHGVALIRFALIPKPAPNAPHLRVLIVQTDVSSVEKSGQNAGLSAFQQAFQLTVNATKKQKYDLVIWPETTAGFLKLPGGGYAGADWVQWHLLGPKVPLLAGVSTLDAQNRRYNEAILIEPDGSTQSYTKRRLVPFGERAPFVDYFPFLQVFSPGGMEPGTKADPIWLPPKPGVTSASTGQSRLAVLPQICFESCFPMSWQRLQASEFAFESVLTNDELSSGTELSRQHRAMGQLRAAEVGRPLIQACNGTYSFVADASGALVASTTDAAPQTLDVTIAAR